MVKQTVFQFIKKKKIKFKIPEKENNEKLQKVSCIEHFITVQCLTH